MSHYTTTVRAICEMSAGLTSNVGYADVVQVLNASWDKIFEDFPIFEEAHREILCKKILRHYYTDEIAFETAGLWKLELNTKMQEIMPKYNELYSISASITNPLYNKSVIKEFTGNVTDDKTSTRTDNLKDTHSGGVKTVTSGTRTDDLTDTNGGKIVTDTDSTRTDNLSSAKTVNTDTTVSSEASTSSDVDTYSSDTPQGSLSDVKSGKYMSSANISDSTTTTKGKDTTSTDTTDTTLDTGTQKNTSKDTVTDSRTLKKTGTVKDEGTSTVTDTSAVAHTGTVSDTGKTVSDSTHTEKVTGYEGSDIQGELLSKYSNTQINIDMMIISELSGLFMQIW
nr:MAG TPA: Lower collar protein [Caudoviricetes sp.]